MSIESDMRLEDLEERLLRIEDENLQRFYPRVL
jgi:hypothetical protein